MMVSKQRLDNFEQQILFLSLWLNKTQSPAI